MLIVERVKSDNLIARKNKDKFTSSILTTLTGELQMIGKNNGNRKTTNEESIKLITKFKKNVGETIDLLRRSATNSKELENFIKEISIYDKYLPKLLDENELTEIIKDIVSHDSDINMGKVMKFLSNQYKGRYDGKIASTITKKLIPKGNKWI